ncbi:MAG TPA: EamA family transporter [Candidatus Limnocylindrales bacterium]|nr:EamA family transporter [Candidatus Limnocylindrales bacterium]
MSRTLLATIACVAAAACWAANAVIAAGAFELGVTPERLAQTRVIVALIPLAAYLLLARRDLMRPPRAAVPALIGFGAGIVAVNFSYYVAIDRVPVGVAVALQYTAPVLVLAGTALIARRSPQPAIWLAGALSLTGAVLVSGALAGATQTLDGLGLLAGVAAALTFAGYLVTAELAGRRGAHPVTTLFIGFCVAAVIWVVVLPPWTWPIELLGEPQVAWRVVAVGLLGTLLPFGLVVAALRWISSAVAGIAATAEPVLAALLAWLFLGQVLSAPQLIGGGLVIAGVLIAQVTRPPEPESVPVEMAP